MGDVMRKEPDDMIATMLSTAAAYCELHGIGLTTLGLTILNDGKFFTKLKRAGDGTCTIKTYTKVMKWFEEKDAQGPGCPHQRGREDESGEYEVSC